LDLQSSTVTIALRPIATTDVDAIMEWINDPEITKNFAGFSEPITRAAELAFVERMIASPNDRLFAIVDATGTCIGTAGIHQIYWPARNGRLGIMLGRARGQGLGRQALRALVATAFGALGLHKVWVVHFADNARMAHLCRTLGFSVEGVLRDEYFHHGRHWNMVRQSLLAPEFATAM
jgi:diamine N-acetyltransferase